MGSEMCIRDSSAYHPEDKKIAEIAQDELDHSRELRKAMLMIA